MSRKAAEAITLWFQIAASIFLSCFTRELHMAGRLIIVSVAASLLFAAGCAKNRGWLSRKDYSEMQDPFMEPGDAVAGSKGSTSKASGRASLEDIESTLAEGRARVPGPGATSDGTAGPKPIRQAGVSSASDENGARVSSASYPEDTASSLAGTNKTGTTRTDGVKSYSGPALSDFLQKKSATARESAALTATEAEQLSTRAVSSAGTAARDAMNPAATRAALPTLNAEAESFSSFLSEKSAKVTEDVQNANANVQTANADLNNFAAWAEEQKSEWSNSANATRAEVPDVPAQVKGKADNVFEQARQATREMANTKFVSPEFDAAADNLSENTAEPLIKRSNPSAAAPTLSKAKPPAVNDFSADVNPFEEFNSSGNASGAVTPPKSSASSATSSRSKSTSGALDDSFRMDTGWKPAQMTRP